MAGDDKEDGAIFEATFDPVTTGGGIKVGSGAPSAIGKAWDALLPGRAAKADIIKAMRERVVKKIAAGVPGEAFDDTERAFMAMIFQKEGLKLERQAAVMERAHQIEAEVVDLVKALPAPTDRSPQATADLEETAEAFERRAEAMSEEVTAKTLQDLFARLLVGNRERPGAFSVSTLDVVRALDPPVARLFERLRSVSIDNRWVLRELPSDFYDARGLHFGAMTALHDARLLVASSDTVLNLDQRYLYKAPGFDLRLRDVPEVEVSSRSRLTGLAQLEEQMARTAPANRFTRAGRELASVLTPAEVDPRFMDAVVAYLVPKATRHEVQTRVRGSEEWVAHPRETKKPKR